MPSLLAHVRAHLPLGDPRHARMEELAVISRHRTLSPVERNILVSVVRASQSEARREVMRVRSFRNVLYIATALMTLAANALRRPACARRARSGGQPDDAGRAPRRTAHVDGHDELAGWRRGGDRDRGRQGAAGAEGGRRAGDGRGGHGVAVAGRLTGGGRRLFEDHLAGGPGSLERTRVIESPNDVNHLC
jgi:hypothetical protein